MKVKSWSNLAREEILVPVSVDDNEYEQMFKEQQQILINSANEKIGTMLQKTSSELIKKNVNDTSATVTIQASETAYKTDNIVKSISKKQEIPLTIEQDKTVSGDQDEVLVNDKIKKYSMDNIDTLSAMECVLEVCPNVKVAGRIVKIDYKVRSDWSFCKRFVIEYSKLFGIQFVFKNEK